MSLLLLYFFSLHYVCIMLFIHIWHYPHHTTPLAVTEEKKTSACAWTTTITLLYFSLEHICSNLNSFLSNIFLFFTSHTILKKSISIKQEQFLISLICLRYTWYRLDYTAQLRMPTAPDTEFLIASSSSNFQFDMYRHVFCSFSNFIPFLNFLIFLACKWFTVNQCHFFV